MALYYWSLLSSLWIKLQHQLVTFVRLSRVRAPFVASKLDYCNSILTGIPSTKSRNFREGRTVWLVSFIVYHGMQTSHTHQATLTPWVAAHWFQARSAHSQTILISNLTQQNLSLNAQLIMGITCMTVGLYHCANDVITNKELLMWQATPLELTTWICSFITLSIKV